MCLLTRSFAKAREGHAAGSALWSCFAGAAGWHQGHASLLEVSACKAAFQSAFACFTTWGSNRSSYSKPCQLNRAQQCCCWLSAVVLAAVLSRTRNSRSRLRFLSTEAAASSACIPVRSLEHSWTACTGRPQACAAVLSSPMCRYHHGGY